MDNIITQEQINTYCASMLADERSAGTVAKYRRDVTAFARWLGGRPVSKENSTGWKAHLLNRGYAPRTINSMLAAVNSFFRFAGWNIKVKFLKIQRQLFRDATRELNRAEYTQLLAAARSNGQERLAHGNALRDGHPYFRAVLYHRRGGAAREIHHLPQGQDPHHPALDQAVPQAAEIRQKAKNRYR